MLSYETLKPLIFQAQPERAHSMASVALKVAKNVGFIGNYIKKSYELKNEILAQNTLGLHFENPIGIGGGFDKNGDLISGLELLGFGFLEYGTFTPRAQDGNPQPRLWRIKEHESLQNAMGFNNEGSAKVEINVKKGYPFRVPVFANIGKNKLTANEEAIKDYSYLARRFDELCDAFVINISSPNTPNLRALQNDSFLAELAAELKKQSTKPLILKIAPDMSENDAISLCSRACELGFGAIIINNTSIDYSLYSKAQSIGGLSGELIRHKSRELFKAVASELFGQVTLISCGGINSASEVLWRIEHGASLVEIFTALVYKGPGLVRKIKGELASMLKIEGYESINEAIGTAIKK